MGEFALRKGHRYGTVLVEVETGRPVDIVDERSPGSSAAWLAARPGAELICRDRAGGDADGGARGAPQAGRVADRWHRRHNLGEAAGRAVTAHRTHLAAAVAAQAAAPAAATAPEVAGSPALPRTGPIADRTRTRHADVHQMLADGRSFSQIAGQPGLARNTVRRFARAVSPDELLVRDGPGQRASILHEHKPYLHQRWNSGCPNAALPWQETRARGHQGSCRQVRGYLPRFRGNAAVPAPVPAPPKLRAVTGWIMTRPDRLADADRASNFDSLLPVVVGHANLAPLFGTNVFQVQETPLP